MCFCICLLCVYMHTLPFLLRTRVSFVLSTLLFIFNNVYAQTCSKTAQGLTTTEMTVISKVSTLATTQWLRKQIGSSNTATRALRILDTSFVRDKQVDTYTMDYLEGHIPQALFFDLHKCVESTPSIPRNLPDPACFTSYVRKLGIWPDTHVVAYDRFGPASAYRTWWLFRLYGHTNISVLDGGYRKWVADGYDTTKEEPEVEPSMFIPQLDRFLVRTFDDMAENLRTCREQVVDARGATDRAVVDTESGGGKIPGSRHVSFEELFNEDGTMKTEEQLKSSIQLKMTLKMTYSSSIRPDSSIKSSRVKTHLGVGPMNHYV
ncbi:thiosulfate sulfurtransferase-like isoform X2 [Dreissena polymorpha]|uniref:thiosulfate sulfurtransferase-like isoform X2 n=1 Tax=Dreissena polymorpha TaxID=45954 RepID=UPI002263AD80|nr:thiosulfate sulfurtransferase-like isoform X2 [Dreissena polymorpha]